MAAQGITIDIPIQISRIVDSFDVLISKETKWNKNRRIKKKKEEKIQPSHTHIHTKQAYAQCERSGAWEKNQIWAEEEPRIIKNIKKMK